MKAEIGTDLEKAKHILLSDGIVAIPTETVYGLAANALSPLAVARIFEAKQRPSFDPLIVHVPDLESALGLVIEFPEPARKLAQAFWPGPLTLILEKSPKIPDIVTSGHPTVGIRVPDHPLTLELLRTANIPLAAPSANPFGFVSPTSAEHVMEQLGNVVPYILNGGPCQVGLESTIIRFEDDEAVVLRLGGAPLEKIEKIMGKPVKEIRTSSSKPDAPGMLIAHYSPGIKLLVGDVRVLLSQFDPERTGIISFNTKYDQVPIENQQILSPDGDLEEAAANLFGALRSFSHVDVILAERFPDSGLGLAINDRLKRAAASR
ncbi:MAG: threonylcarbamoyl-AMP synthase [Bacteroidota bacterium]|nr:threonylcarbamoyl-AMP synthase [Bacteroidota bacterium]